MNSIWIPSAQPNSALFFLFLLQTVAPFNISHSRSPRKSPEKNVRAPRERTLGSVWNDHYATMPYRHHRHGHHRHHHHDTNIDIINQHKLIYYQSHVSLTKSPCFKNDSYVIIGRGTSWHHVRLHHRHKVHLQVAGEMFWKERWHWHDVDKNIIPLEYNYN